MQGAAAVRRLVLSGGGGVIEVVQVDDAPRSRYPCRTGCPCEAQGRVQVRFSLGWKTKNMKKLRGATQKRGDKQRVDAYWTNQLRQMEDTKRC